MSASESQPARQFELSLSIAAPPQAVWKAISESSEIVRWFAPVAEVEPGVGGQISWSWGDLYRWPQAIEIWEPNKRLRTRYESSIEDGAGGHVPLFVDFTLEGSGGATTLRLVHSGFGPDSAFDQEFDGISGGWPVELRSLRLYAEKHFGTRRQLAWSTTGLDLPHADAWELLTGAEGLDCGEEIDSLKEGEPFRFQTADGDVFEGTALHCFEHEFSGIVHGHGDGFLRFTVEDCSGTSNVWVWLATYGQPDEDTQAIQERFDAMVARLFTHAPNALRTANQGQA